jgi:hypothetical protein
LAPEVGLEPIEAENENTTCGQHEAAKPLQNNTLATTPTSTDSQKATPSTQGDNKLQQPKCVPAVYQNLPEDLMQVVAAWPKLSDDSKRKIVDLVTLSRP